MPLTKNGGRSLQITQTLTDACKECLRGKGWTRLRQARLDRPGPLHQAMIRAIELGDRVRGDEDREEFLSRMGELVEETNTKI